MKLLYTLFFTLITLATISAQQEWELVGPLPIPAATDHSYAFAFEDKGYFVAGASEFAYVDDFYEYDATTETWTQLDDFPGGPRGFGIGDTWDGKAYFGFGFSGSAYMDDLWMFDPVTKEWTELAPCPCTPRVHPAFIAHNDKIFVGLGGSQQGNLNDWWEYDMATDSWEQKPSFPGLPRHHPFQFGIGDYVYAGFGHGDNFISNRWYRYDPATEEWTEMASLPSEGRVAGTQFSYEGKGYVLSGDGQDHTSMEEGEFWSYDPELDLWEALPPHPGWSRWAPTSFVLDGWVYLLSGPTNIFGELDYEAIENFRFQLEEDVTVSTQNLTTDPSLFEVFPNPFTQQIQFNWKEAFITAEGELRILDNLGRTTFYQNGALPTVLDLNFLPAGLYHLEAIVQDTRLVKKIVKK